MGDALPHTQIKALDTTEVFRTAWNRSWVFQGEFVEPDGEKRIARLFYAATVPIKRHVKIRGEANPYDPAWEVTLSVGWT